MQNKIHKTCNTCKHKANEWYDHPCDGCTFGKHNCWEPDKKTKERIKANEETNKTK